ncbi:MAG: hypothetical protein IVW54_07405 [Candidatus Binataceae bacterium]|nr:hypothetical protein [Candidatus Binataceae bacterium]
MRRVAIGLSLALILGFSPIVHAQYHENQQNPADYNEDDSQPLKIASYFIAPIGFALEWTVARPLNYLANRTPLAPALNPDADQLYKPPKMADLPPPDEFPPEPYEKNPSEASVPVVGTPMHSSSIQSGSHNSHDSNQTAMH